MLQQVSTSPVTVLLRLLTAGKKIGVVSELNVPLK